MPLKFHVVTYFIEITESIVGAHIKLHLNFLQSGSVTMKVHNIVTKIL